MTSANTTSHTDEQSIPIPTHTDELLKIKDDIESLKFHDPKLSDAKIARSTGISPSQLSQILNKKYPSTTTETFSKIVKGIQRLQMRQINDGKMRFAETSVYKLFVNAAEEALNERETDAISMVCGHVGVGKSIATRKYCLDNPNALYIRADYGMTKNDLLNKLSALLNLPKHVRTTLADKRRQIVNALENKEKLIILDEATKATNQVLETLRGISDETCTGLMFSGRERLYDRLASNEGELAEIASRIITWWPVVRCLTEDDVYKLVNENVSGLSEECIEMIDQCCERNARKLKNILRKVKAWTTNNPEISMTPAVISSIDGYCAPKTSTWRNQIDI